MEIGRFPMTIPQRVKIFYLRNFILSYDLTDVVAAQQALDFAIGWYADPVYLGFYPDHMKEMLGDRLPEFSQEEWALVKGSSDFYGMNTYTTNLASMHLSSQI
jgi:beta-glucosidase/6-phospho-beta-glucosidase/beta-galactosidase